MRYEWRRPVKRKRTLTADKYLHRSLPLLWRRRLRRASIHLPSSPPSPCHPYDPTFQVF